MVGGIYWFRFGVYMDKDVRKQVWVLTFMLRLKVSEIRVQFYGYAAVRIALSLWDSGFARYGTLEAWGAVLHLRPKKAVKLTHYHGTYTLNPKPPGKGYRSRYQAPSQDFNFRMPGCGKGPIIAYRVKPSAFKVYSRNISQQWKIKSKIEHEMDTLGPVKGDVQGLEKRT